MEIALISFIIFALAAGGLALGLIQGKRLKGSCGGLNNLNKDGKTVCEICGADGDSKEYCKDET